jgi:Fe2+ transport system protein B
MNDYKESLAGTRDFDLDNPGEEELKKAVEEKEEAEAEKLKALEETEKLKKELNKAKKKIKTSEDRLHRSMRQNEDALAEATRAQDELLSISEIEKHIYKDLSRYDKPEKKKFKLNIPFEAYMLVAVFIAVGLFIWFMVAMTLRQSEEIKERNNTVDVHISYYEDIKKWTIEVPGLSEKVKELRADGKITYNEYVEIKKELDKLRKEKVAREAMGDG